MHPGKDQGTYRILFKGLRKNTVINRNYTVRPVFEEGSDYKSAMKVFDRQFRNYQEEKKLREAEEKRRALEAEKLVKENMKKIQKQQLKPARIIKVPNNSDLNPEPVASNAHVTDPNLNYQFVIKKLGWANIDRLFHLSTTDQVKLVTRISNISSFHRIYVTLVLPKRQMYIPGYQKRDLTYNFSHGDMEVLKLPVGDPATVVASCEQNGQLYLATQSFNISRAVNISLELKPTDSEQLKASMKSLF
jgi:hypothetical protein